MDKNKDGPMFILNMSPIVNINMDIFQRKIG